MTNRYIKLFLALIVLLHTFTTFSEVKFVHLTDLHIYNSAAKEIESRNSFTYLHFILEKINDRFLDLQTNTNVSYDFGVITGDIGIENLLKLEPSEHKFHDNECINIDNICNYLVINQPKWDKGVKDLAYTLQDSLIKKWFFVPGNNDIYNEDDKNIIFYRQFIKDLNNTEEIKKSGITIIDFRLETKDEYAGVYKKENFAFIGFDNAFFKNNNSIKRFIDQNNVPIPIVNTQEYQHLKKLEKALKDSKAKYAYIFFHIPEIDDPWLIQFDADDEDVSDNGAYMRINEAFNYSTTIAKQLYPYSAWTVPIEIHKMWEDIVTNKNFKTPLVEGLFAGHFHDNKKQSYIDNKWIKDKRYLPEILSKYYIAPSVAAKNQLNFSIKDRARGGQIITIKDNGQVERELFWLQ